MKYAISSPNAPKPAGRNSQGTSAARYAFVSGQMGIDPVTNAMVGKDVASQTEQAIHNVEAILAEVECTLADVTAATVYLMSMDDLAELERVWGALFPSPRPARTIVEVSRLEMPDACVAVSATACR